MDWRYLTTRPLPRGWFVAVAPILMVGLGSTAAIYFFWSLNMMLLSQETPETLHVLTCAALLVVWGGTLSAFVAALTRCGMARVHGMEFEVLAPRRLSTQPRGGAGSGAQFGCN